MAANLHRLKHHHSTEIFSAAWGRIWLGHSSATVEQEKRERETKEMRIAM